MKKLALLIAVALMAAPAMADVTIELEEVDGWIEISYAATDADNIPRAFGLDITVENGEITEYDDSGTQPFWVYPGSIDIEDGDIIAEGSPVAPSGDPGALDPEEGITIEMGSLYEMGVEDGPEASGLLLRVQVSEGATSITVDANTTRAASGVVLEDVSDAETNMPVTLDLDDPPADFYVGLVVGDREVTQSHVDNWNDAGQPESWLRPHQQKGDITGNNRVAAGDVTLLVEAFGSEVGDEDYNPAADLSWNGRVAAGDVTILVEYFGSEFDE